MARQQVCVLGSVFLQLGLIHELCHADSADSDREIVEGEVLYLDGRSIRAHLSIGNLTEIERTGLEDVSSGEYSEQGTTALSEEAVGTIC